MRTKRNILLILQVLLIPCVVFFCLEFPENPYFYTLPATQIIINLVISAILSAVIILVIPGIYTGICLTFILAAFSGILNALIIQFRTYPISPADVISIGTAKAVAGGYTIHLTLPMIITGVAAALAIGFYLLLHHFGYGFGRETKRIYEAGLLTGILAASLLFVLIHKLDIDNEYDLETYYWDPTRTYIQNGFALSFMDQLHDMIVEKPEGYTKKQAKAALKDPKNDIETQKPDFSGFSNKAPVVVTIMNESFTDYNAVCDFPDNDSCLDYYYSLKDDPGTVEWGYSYVSTRGGGTCKSEFEELTGFTMQYLPSTMPYMMYSFSGVRTYVGAFNGDGYDTVAMHPFFATNWKRNIVYGEMGFDSFLYAVDYDDSHLDARDYKDDVGDYERLLTEIDAHGGSTFIMNITLQNHGGYDAETFPEYVTELSGEFNDCEDLKVFQGMMKASDDALRMLMAELKKLDRPVCVVFFGDHQPGLSAGTEELLRSRAQNHHTDEAKLEQSFYATPYFIWTNYSVPDTSYKKGVDGCSIISLNYLGAMTRYYLGEELSDFDGFMLRLRDAVPVINSNGYYVDGLGWRLLDEKDGLPDAIKQQLLEYEYIQYRRMFDNK